MFDDIVHATGVTAGRHPLGSLESMAGATVVVRQRAECGDRRATQHEFVTVERVGDQAALGARKKNLSSGTLNTCVPTANSDDAVRRQGRVFGCLRSSHNSLTECEFVSGRSPIGRLSEVLGHFKYQLIGMLVHAGFEIGLIDQVDAVLIAQIVPTLLVRIVRGADGVLVSARRLDTTNFLR